MPRIPALKPEYLDQHQKRIYDDVAATTGRLNGPSLGYIYSPGLWETTNAVSAHFADCSLSQRHVRIAALVTARYWDADFPFAAQARIGLDDGIEREIIDAINARQRPNFSDPEDATVYDLAIETVENHKVSDETFAKAADLLGYPRMVDIVGAVGHYCKVSLMASFAGAAAPDDMPVKLAP